MSASDGEEQGARQAKAARDAAQGDDADARGRCKALEVELQGLHDEIAKEVRIRQEREEEMKAREDAIKGRDA